MTQYHCQVHLPASPSCQPLKALTYGHLTRMKFISTACFLMLMENLWHQIAHPNILSRTLYIIDGMSNLWPVKWSITSRGFDV